MVIHAVILEDSVAPTVRKKRSVGELRRGRKEHTPELLCLEVEKRYSILWPNHGPTRSANNIAAPAR